MSRCWQGLYATAFLAMCGVSCGGDDGSSNISPDGSLTFDGPVTAHDATTCELTGYPPVAGVQDLMLAEPLALDLVGKEDRCLQIQQALLSTTNRPAPLTSAENDFIVQSCEYDKLTDADIIRLHKTTFAGEPLYGSIQDILAHVSRKGDTLTFLAGRIIPADAGQGVGAACLSSAAVADSIPGLELEYLQFEACVPQEPGVYTIAADDHFTVGEPGWFLDGADNLRRVYIVPVFLLESHVDDEVGNSDAYCCLPEQDLTDCVGANFIIDAMTGEKVSQVANCHTC